ncbi:phosphatidylcholine/phosphatidylserine synthase [Sphingomonas panacisoli]|uniref:Phosphatidylcholine/phosphatidylserine synthase n=1 Tax=Sphingomonas panacisoli TaxID=1813879 RepID=A0A5B8LGS8_9SPHN|nr:phosphatidylcholine/phosphatidylserine synthase [Sphingomonas panacisoli]QDZ07508.1 phosphatidylcholine/phosphatidylserine synthase [Sphingomonas panacisoli]
MRPPGPLRRRQPQGLPLRTITPNALTALALCSGLTGVRFAIAAAGGPVSNDTSQWQLAVIMILVASALDGVDGQVARLLRGTSRFGAELDSLSDAISFGVAPALILYLWSLTNSPKFGWACALLFAVFCALRLARFNAAIDATDQPRKAAGYFTGIPAPAGAIGAMLPMYLWFITDDPLFRSPWLVAPWVAFMAVLMVSSVATLSWSSMRLRRRIRFEALVVIVGIGAALISAPWPTLVVICAVYLATIPFSIAGYARVRRLRANMSVAPPA